MPSVTKDRMLLTGIFLNNQDKTVVLAVLFFCLEAERYGILFYMGIYDIK